MFIPSKPMIRSVVIALMCLAGAALAQASTVTYGRVTAVAQGTASTANAQSGGAVVGGALGLMSGSNQSASNQALRGLTGAAAGRRVGSMASTSPTFEYTVLVDGTSTIRVVTEQAGKRVGDCVSVERGNFNNIRLVDDARCERRAPPASAAVKEANACDQAKAALLKTETDADFDRAERRVRLLCTD